MPQRRDPRERLMTVGLTCEPLTDPVAGVWCPHCRLPSVFAAMYRICERTTGATLALRLWQACADCGRQVELTGEWGEDT